MNVAPSLELGHLELHLAENTDSKGCFCCWKSKAKMPKEYIFDGEGHLIPVYKRVDELRRAVANAKLNEQILKYFEASPISNEEAFRLLKDRLQENCSDCSIPITRERIGLILDEMHALRVELEKRHSKKKDHSKSKSVGERE